MVERGRKVAGLEVGKVREYVGGWEGETVGR